MKQTEFFFNTINLEGPELSHAKEVTGEQDKRVLEIFQDHIDKKLTPYDCCGIYELRYRRTPITSIRRSITVLTKQGKLEKLNEQGPGGYGKPNFYWRLALPHSNKTIVYVSRNY